MLLDGPGSAVDGPATLREELVAPGSSSEEVSRGSLKESLELELPEESTLLPDVLSTPSVSVGWSSMTVNVTILG